MDSRARQEVAKAYRVVAKALRHFLAISREHHSVADQVFESRLVVEDCRKHHKTVEPTSSLVDSYTEKAV